jgi:hypothetical protein
VQSYRTLAIDSPGRYRAYLASSLDNLALRYSDLGRPAEALPPTQEGLTIRRELAAGNPGRYRAEIARSLDRLGVRYWELGSATRAIAPAEEAIIIYRGLASVSPTRYPRRPCAVAEQPRGLAMGGKAPHGRTAGDAGGAGHPPQPHLRQPGPLPP